MIALIKKKFGHFDKTAVIQESSFFVKVNQNVYKIAERRNG